MRTNHSLVMASCLTALSLVLANCAPPVAAPTPPVASAAPTPKLAASPEAKPTAPAATPKPAVETPRYGGIFTSAITGNPPSLDIQQDATSNAGVPASPFYSYFVQADPLTVDKLVPGLAKKWETSKEGLTWTFDIRQGVKFHDGTPFTVDDAVFNIQRLSNPPKGITIMVSSVLKPVIKSVEKEGNKVRLGLNYPFAVMLETFAHNYSPFYSKQYIEKHGDMKTTAMGTGPFKLKSYTPGVSVEAVKNPDFWVKGRPYLDGYRYLIIKDQSTRLSAFRTGKLNRTGKTFGALSPTEVETIKKEQPQLKLYPAPSLIGSWFYMNLRNPPFKDPRVRKAISLALDRQAALKVVAQGQGVIGRPFPVDPWGIPLDEALKMPGFRQPKDADLAEAKKLMGAAGYPDGFDLTILARQMPQSKDPAVYMTGQLSQLGIKAKVNVLEDAIFWDIGRKAAHEAMVYTPFWTINDPHWQSRFLVPGGAVNFSGNDDDTEGTQMWEEQIRFVDPEKRKAFVRKLEKHILDVLPGIAIVWLQFHIGVRPEVRNFTPGISDEFGNTLEEIWLAK